MKYRQCLNEINIDGFDFTYGFKCSDVHKYEKLNNFSFNIFELSFYQDQNKRKHNLIPIEIIKNDSDRVVDNENDNSNLDDKTTNILNQNPILNS